MEITREIIILVLSFYEQQYLLSQLNRTFGLVWAYLWWQVPANYLLIDDYPDNFNRNFLISPVITLSYVKKRQTSKKYHYCDCRFLESSYRVQNFTSKKFSRRKGLLPNNNYLCVSGLVFIEGYRIMHHLGALIKSLKRI